LNTKAVPRLFAANNWVLEKLPQIKTADLKTPSIKEIALLLRSMKIDMTKNKELLNFMLNLMHAPTMSEEVYNEFIAAREAQAEDEMGGADDADMQDTADNDAKQSDEAYVGGE
jgi:hypothetical protein